MATPSAERPDSAEFLKASSHKSKRIVELDALRALAAINLLLFHYTLVFPNKYGFTTPLGFEMPYGKYGVQLFFMLSGFVNAMTLFKKRQPGEFLVARFIRILPSYWLLLILNFVLFSSFAMYGVQVTPDAALANATVMPGLFGYSAWEPVTWTLQVEMLFYAILMVLFMGGAFRNTLRTTIILLGISGFGTILIWQLQSSNPEAISTHVAQFLSELFILKHLPLFVTGILLHEIWNKRTHIALNGIGIIAAAIVFHLIDEHHHNPAVTVLLFTLLAMAAFGKLPVLRLRPFVFISTISYSLYLFHNNLGCLLIRWVNDAGLPPLASVVLAFVFSVAFASVVTFWLEQPTTRYLRKRWALIKSSDWAGRFQTSTNHVPS